MARRQAEMVPDLGAALGALPPVRAQADLPAWATPARATPTPTTGNAQRGAVDWDVVVVLRRRASEEISDAVDLWAREHARTMPLEDRRMLGRSVIRQVVRAHAEHLAQQGQALWPIELEQAYASAVDNAIFGYGRLQPLFEIPDAENIEIHGWDGVVVQYGDGRREPHPPVADSDEELVEAIRFLGESANPSRPFDDAHPMMTLALGDRFRLHAIGFGLSFRPSIVIRQHILTSVTLRQLAEGGMMPLELAGLLHEAVLARKSMVISGDQAAASFELSFVIDTSTS
ncbi:hypothetical protein ACTQ49_10135 [Luteococcus sp. Sow4_B9]|uniref:hypothetical protein n=1 Tax=Luteococcus sp. Sow4_B9 TaxID=3438792 RepID=UPI003F97AB5D